VYCIIFLSTDTYKKATKLIVHNNSNESIEDFVSILDEQTSSAIGFYNGSFPYLLELSPHMAAFNINVFDVTPEGANLDVTLIYNDTLQHSLPVAINMISNAYFQ
jgi:ATP-binding cassette subfamily A (ABC1) protein 5